MWQKNTFVVTPLRLGVIFAKWPKEKHHEKQNCSKKNNNNAIASKLKNPQHEHLDPRPIPHIHFFLPTEIPLLLQFVHKDVLYVVLVSVVFQLICFYLSSDSSYQSVHRAKPEWATV